MTRSFSPPAYVTSGCGCAFRKPVHTGAATDTTSATPSLGSTLFSFPTIVLGLVGAATGGLLWGSLGAIGGGLVGAGVGSQARRLAGV